MSAWGGRAFARAGPPHGSQNHEHRPTRPGTLPEKRLPRANWKRSVGRSSGRPLGARAKREEPMQRASARLWLTAGTFVSSALMIAAATAQPAGSDDLLKMQTNAANVVMPTITY